MGTRHGRHHHPSGRSRRIAGIVQTAAIAITALATAAGAIAALIEAIKH